MNPTSDLPEAATATCAPDLARYAPHVAHLSMPDARKAEMLHAVWHVMRSFVDRAFGDDAAQLCRNPVDGGSATREAADEDVIDSQPISQFEDAGGIAPAFNKHGGSDRKERT